jgi:hypothetical protein
MSRFHYVLLVAALQIMSFGTQAAGVDFSSSAQAGFEWSFGSHKGDANHASLRVAAGYTQSYGNVVRLGGVEPGPGDVLPSQQVVFPMMDFRVSTEPGGNAFHLAGFSMLARHSSQDAANGSDQSWFNSNWGWVAAGAATVAVVVVAAAGGGGSSTPNTSGANQCQVTVIGGSQTNTSGCPK